MSTSYFSREFVVRAMVILFAAGLSFSMGCGGTSPVADTTGPAGDGSGVANSNQLSSKGTLSGTIAETRTTRDSGDAGGAAQVLPLTIDATSAVVTFEDIEGRPLLDVNGDPYPAVPVDLAGTFLADGLPVGIDFVVVVDIDGDGVPDISQFVQIPADETSVEGRLDNVVVDPLSTLVVAKLRRLFEEQGVDARELGISPTAIVARLVDAFIHLFEETGIDRSLTLDDIENLAQVDLEAVFEALIPPAVRNGFDTVEGNLALERAGELEGVMQAAAEVFLRAGFPIADEPGGLDLSFLADLPNVAVKSIDELFQRDEFVPNDGPGTRGPSRAAPTVYVNTVVEPDRNHIGDRDFAADEEFDRLPFLNEHLLRRMGELHLQGRGITLGNLYRLLTDTEIGLGVRLTYSSPAPFFEGPPAMVFETADGDGAEVNLDALFFGLDFTGLDNPEANADLIDAHEANLRALVRDLLASTVPPSFERLFGAFVSDRLEGVNQLFRFIRESKAHLPFSRSGPSTFFVVADGDQFDSASANSVNPVTVDIVFGDDYMPMSITRNPSHTGEFFLGFTHETDERHIVELLLRETGRPLHGPQGEPLFLDMGNGDLFQPVDGRAFIDFVSDSGTFFPGVPVSVPNPDFRLFEPHDEQIAIAAAGGQEVFGPTMHLFVLATEPGFNGEPVRVDYNIADDTFTYNPNGRYYLMFVEETVDQGLFGLFDIDLNFMPTVHDLTADRFLDLPGGFDDFPTDGFVFVDADGDGFPEDIDPDDNDPTIIPDDPFGGFDFVDADGDGFPAAIDPDDNDPTIIPDDPFGGPGFIDADGDGFPADIDPDDNDPTIIPNDPFGGPGFIDADGDGFPADIDPDDNDPTIIPNDPFGGPGFIDADGDGFTADIDPDDNDPTIIPNDPFGGPGFIDADGDGFTADIDPDDNDPTIIPEPPAPQQVPGDPTDVLGPPDGGNFFPDYSPVLVSPQQVIGLAIRQEFFAFVFGTEVPNRNFDPSGNPFFDDVNGNGIEDAGEFTSDWRPLLFDANDWRATDITRYYRRASGGGITMDEVAFDASTPKATDGEVLVPRRFLPRLNAFRFGRPNAAINLLTTFLPSEFFNGTQAINEDTEVGIFQALAMINMVMEQVFNVDAETDIDGPGPIPPTTELIDAHLFVVPIGDPLALLIDGFEQLSRARPVE